MSMYLTKFKPYNCNDNNIPLIITVKYPKNSFFIVPPDLIQLYTRKTILYILIPNIVLFNFQIFLNCHYLQTINNNLKLHKKIPHINFFNNTVFSLI